MAQPYIDCAIELKEKGVEAADITSIVCEVGEGTVHRLWEPLALKHSPPSPYGAKFSTPYCMAVGFVDGDAGLAQFTDAKIADPAVLGFAAKIGYEIDPDNEYPANFTGHLRATLKDGTVHEIRRAEMRGGVRAPLSRADLVAKAGAAVGFVDGDAGLAQFTDAKIADPAVLGFAAKIGYEIDPDNEYPANFTGHLRATLKDGTVHEIRRAEMRGGVRAPLSRADLVAKAKKNMAFGGWEEARAEQLIAFSESFGEDAGPLTLAAFAA